MVRSRCRRKRVAKAGWAASALTHGVLAWAALLIFIPQEIPSQPIELDAARVQPGARLIVYDLAIAAPRPSDAPRLTEVLGDMSAGPLPVMAPRPTQVSAPGGVGKDLLSAGTLLDASGGKGRASFFGTQAEGNRFIYIVDTSGSMSAGAGRRLKRAVSELLRSVDALSAEQFFYVLLFSSHTRQLFGATEMVQATNKNKVRLRRWLRGLRPAGGTHPQEALLIALRMRPSAIFLLSDGRFSRGRPRFPGGVPGVEPEVRELVADHDPGDIPIHTVAFEEPKAKENLREISNMTSGQFTYVPETFRARMRLRKAASWMAVAEKLEAEGRADMAQRYYQQVIEHFAGTEFALEAGRRRHEYLLLTSADE